MVEGSFAHWFNKDHLVRFFFILESFPKAQFQSIALFSLYLTPKSVGNAEMTIGGIDESKFKGEIAPTPESSSQ